MIARRIALLAALIAGVVFSQVPEFAQQYRQRLGGALGELNTIVQDFSANSARNGVDVATAIARLDDNADPLAKARGAAMTRTIARRDALTDQQAAMNAAGPIGRIFALARYPDSQIVRGAWAQFEPAVPVTSESLMIAGLGAAIAYVVTRILGLPFRRRRPLQA